MNFWLGTDTFKSHPYSCLGHITKMEDRVTYFNMNVQTGNQLKFIHKNNSVEEKG